MLRRGYSRAHEEAVDLNKMAYDYSFMLLFGLYVYIYSMVIRYKNTVHVYSECSAHLL